MTLPPAVVPALRAALAAAAPAPLGVAVSGGGDSLALLLMLEAAGGPVEAATVDHGLRPSSAAEAAAVAAFCAARGVPHRTLVWQDGAAGPNLQARARDARRRLLADWARERGLGAVALGHSRDDQAETFLLRLARGSGVDGLSGMAEAVRADGLLWLRPLLGLTRRELREWLMRRGVAWTEDPSNDDARYDRVRARAALGALAPLGLDAARLAATAARMGRARAALEAATAALARDCLADGGAGDLLLAPAAFGAAPEEIRLRLLAATLGWVSGAVYRPRLASLEALLAAIDSGRLAGGATLHGCLIRTRRGAVAICREPARAAPPVPLAAGRWDGRWQVGAASPELAADLTVGALGPDLARFDWRATRLRREALLTTPAIRCGDTLVAAPVVAASPDFAARRFSALAAPWEGMLLR